MFRETFMTIHLVLIIARNPYCTGYEDDYPAETTTQGEASLLFPPEKTTSTTESEMLKELDAIDDGKESEEIFPEGFDIVDGVILDITNVLIQEVMGNKTEYRPYTSNKTDGTSSLPKEVKYSRAKEEAGWHFIMFEDPDEDSGSGNMILLQKLTGFTVGSNRESNGYPRGDPQGSKEIRLYQAFHIKLGDEFEEEEDNDQQASGESDTKSESKTETPTDTMPSDDVSRNRSSPVNPYDNAELVGTDFENQAIVDSSKNEAADNNNDRDKQQNQEDQKKVDKESGRLYQSSDTVLGDDNSRDAQDSLKKFESESSDSTTTTSPGSELGINSAPSESGFNSAPSESGVNAAPSESGFNASPSESEINSIPSESGLNTAPSESGFNADTSYSASTTPKVRQEQNITRAEMETMLSDVRGIQP